MASAQNLFDKYGGFAAVRSIVFDLYERIQRDALIGGYFANVNFSRIVDHQTKFVSSVMGGPASYTDEHLERVHRHLPIDDAEFDRLIAILLDVLEDRGVVAEDKAAIAGELEERRGLMVKA